MCQRDVKWLSVHQIRILIRLRRSWFFSVMHLIPHHINSSHFCQSSPHRSHKPNIDKQETTETFTISDRTSNKNCQSRYKQNKKDKSWRLHSLHCFSFLLITEPLVSFDFWIMTSFDNRAVPLILTADKSAIGLSSYHPWNWRSYSKLLDVIILPYSVCLLRHQ